MQQTKVIRQQKMSINCKEYRPVNIEIRKRCIQREEKWRLDKCTEIERMTITNKVNIGKEINELRETKCVLGGQVDARCP